MALWFLSIAVLGIWGIAQRPAVLLAIDPRYGLNYLFSGGSGSFLVLGGVFLCVTGADDARAREVRPRHSSWEADEQSGLGHSGAGGAKGGGREERGSELRRSLP